MTKEIHINPKLSVSTPITARGVMNIMEYKGVSNYALAKKTGIKQSTIGRFFKGNTSMSIDNFMKICEALGINVIFESE